ncbi:MAG: PEP-CTERM sorting domain-containing protein [Opitutus sp.]|nr:PEP-CTERM sorting domain-containing protein [Opitutus sp.]MCS6247821.1 PEP-CTERM sorting domain-containing protein [Opitutus sp.]MCS6275150.1 PEP-CTERM sorting domain-containing protein [Opitutus sp.]MCS6276278.1 PEP-CTERM sorting domain-containing protein [Opitutus sp.]MCS6301372.1 PEP-CTERM sorting domain-containing protein [Opitutus sp.]
MKLSVTSFAKACFRFSSLALVVLGLSHLTASAGVAPSPIFSEDFNNFTGGTISPGTQFETANKVKFGASLTGWNATGGNAIHAVEYTTGNSAVMIFSGNGGTSVNKIQTTASYAANDSGTTYVVAYDFSAAVYQDGNQATASGDGLRFMVLLGSNNATVISDVTQTVGAWTHNMLFTTGTFSYVGTGEGDVQFLITAANTNTVRFAGAVDNFSVTTASAVPEPSTYAAIFGVLALGAAAFRRRQTRA